MQSHTNFIRFVWQAWHKLTSTVVLRGRRGTDGTGWRAWTGLGAPWSRVTPRHSAWQAWHLVTFTFVLRGRRGTNSHLPSFCVAGVGQMALGGALGLAWARLGRAWRRGILRGRRGTWWHSLSFCVAGVAQTHIYRRFAWQAWDRWHWVARLDWLGRALVARDAAAFCVAGVALGDIHFRSAWQAWHKLTSTVVLRGRRGTDGTGWRAWTGLGAPWSRVTPRHSAWQAWHLVTFTFALRGRRGTNSHLPSFCVAGVGQMALGGALGLAWARLGRAWRRGILRGRRGTWWHSLSFCVAGVAQTHIYTVVLCGRRGTNSHLPSFCVAGVGQMALGGVLGVSNSSCVLRLVFVSNCKCGCRPVSSAWFARMAARRTARLRAPLPVLACLLSDMFNSFLLVACFLSSHICGQVVVFVLFATTGRAQLRLEQHFHYVFGAMCKEPCSLTLQECDQVSML